MLAWEMNGDILPKIHGYPLRTVVFGYIGARSVKWLYRIKAIKEPSRAPVQSRGVPLLSPAGGKAQLQIDRRHPDSRNARQLGHHVAMDEASGHSQWQDPLQALGLLRRRALAWQASSCPLTGASTGTAH